MIDSTSAYGLDFLFPSGDDTVGRFLAWWGEFARVEVDFIRETMAAMPEPGEMIDVGANIGAISLPIAAALPRWRVVGIEAHRGLAGLFAANALNNRLANVEAIHAAAGAERGVADFPSPPLSTRINFGTLGFGADGPTEPVRVLALDDVASASTRVVKVDVEGFEPVVLAGAARTLREVRPVWIVEASKARPEPGRSAMKTLAEGGYSLHWLFAPFVTARPHKPGPPNLRLTRGDFNVVALPPGAPNVWSLPALAAVDEPWPTSAAQMPYLGRYGLA